MSAAPRFTMSTLRALESSMDREVRSTARVILGIPAKDADEVMAVYNQALEMLERLISSRLTRAEISALRTDWRPTIESILAREEIPAEPAELFPLPWYFAAAADDDMTVGVAVHLDGKIELFEGNDEASEKTYGVLEALTGDGDEEVTVYGNHDDRIITKAAQDGALPDGIYVSPNREHAAGYWGVGRTLFSARILRKHLRRESDIDWRVKGPAPVRKLRTF